MKRVPCVHIGDAVMLTYKSGSNGLADHWSEANALVTRITDAWGVVDVVMITNMGEMQEFKRVEYRTEGMLDQFRDNTWCLLEESKQ